MKKTILLSSILAVGAAFATDVESANAIGALDVTITTSPKQTLIAAPFVGYETDGEIKVKDIVKTSNLKAGSKLYAVNSDGGYNTWTLDANGAWAADQYVSVIAGGQPSVGTAENQGEATIKRGDAFWIEPIFDDSITEGTIFLLGQTSVEAGTSSASGNQWNLIGNASVEAFNIAGLSGANGDQIVVQNGSALKYYTYNTTKGGWCITDKGKLTKQDTLSIPAGHGFWYKPASDTVINWSTVQK